MKKKVLYISTNDGSDMRINKEIRTLSTEADVFYLGVGAYSDRNFAKAQCCEFHLIEKKRNSFKAIALQIKKFRELTGAIDFDSVHIINEQLMIFFYPFLFNQHVVLDIFDSVFMKKNKPGNKLKGIKKIVYNPIDFLLVTDENRFSLMPDFVKDRLRVLENYPNRYQGNYERTKGPITIFYNGSMSSSRGTNLLADILSEFQDVKIIMAGWIADQSTQDLANSDHVDFRGVVDQMEASRIAAEEADYIMCCYEPSNQNNINASPNKIYDAIQTKTPVIMNREVKVSAFVIDNNLGVIIDSFYDYDIKKVYQELLEKRNSFVFSKEKSEKYSWESIEYKLLEVHNLS